MREKSGSPETAKGEQPHLSERAATYEVLLHITSFILKKHCRKEGRHCWLRLTERWRGRHWARSCSLTAWGLSQELAAGHQADPKLCRACRPGARGVGADPGGESKVGEHLLCDWSQRRR